LVVGSGSCRSFRTEENSLLARPLEQRGQHILVGNSNCSSPTAPNKVEDQIIAMGLGNAQARSEGVRILPCFGDLLPFLEGFRNGSASAGLDRYHFGTLCSRAQPSQLL